MVQKSLSELKNEVSGCTRCELCKTRTNVVFGSGNENARIMFIGEAPGEKEDLSGIPFVGRAGQLLDKFLEAIELDRESVYIANMCKCRPPSNRDPRPEEQDMCIEYLREQVRIIKPSLIVCLGRISAQRLISPDFKVTKQHGEVYDKNGFNIMGTFHPAALLRNPNQKPEALKDFLIIKEYAKGL
ncbi:MAG: uracil-DNA glycosylase [Clostridia bacterium]|nr:uracil-DNA glycosylase [Clostridia bacterium]